MWRFLPYKKMQEERGFKSDLTTCQPSFCTYLDCLHLSFIYCISLCNSYIHLPILPLLPFMKCFFIYQKYSKWDMSMKRDVYNCDLTTYQPSFCTCQKQFTSFFIQNSLCNSYVHLPIFLSNPYIWINHILSSNSIRFWALRLWT